MIREISLLFLTILMSAGAPYYSSAIREGDKTYIIDRLGEKWDVTQAESLGFKPERFQYGIGRHAFITLDDSYLTEDLKDVSENLRIIGIATNSDAQAYSISRLYEHEISNSYAGTKPVVVGY